MDKNKKNVLVAVACGIIIFIAVIGIISTIAKGASNAKDNVKTAAQVSAQSSKTKEIYSDNLIAMSFVQKYDMSGMKGEFFFSVKAENKSSKKITVYLQDAYLNNSMVQIGSGVPLDLLAGKNSVHSFFGKYEGTGASNANEIKKIGFKICVMDENSKIIETTNPVEITF
jgi:hypothetical protein